MQQAPSIARAVDANKVAESRLPEVPQMHDLCQGARYGVGGLPRHLRRRTRSHNSYKHAKRPKVTGANAGGAEVGKAEAVMRNRKMRRKAMFRTYQGNPWVSSSSPSGHQRYLPTHVFHAKRMTMKERSGFVLSEGQPGKGHGTRSFAHKLETGCVVHDASYWCSIEVVFRGGRGGEGRAAAVRRVVDAAAGDGKRLVAGAGAGDVEEGAGATTFWAHYAYAEEAVGMVKALEGVDGAAVRVGRLGRIELRGPRSDQVLAAAVASLASLASSGTSNTDCPWHAVERVGDAGCTVGALREAYGCLFKAICGTGLAMLCGQREWHWCRTMHGQLYYPDDYCSDGAEGASVPVRVWVRNEGVLEAGMELVDEAGNVVGAVTSPKPRMLSNKYCSIGWAQLDADGGGCKWRLSARRRGGGGARQRGPAPRPARGGPALSRR